MDMYIYRAISIAFSHHKSYLLHLLILIIIAVITQFIFRVPPILIQEDMISSKKLIKMARKWQRIASINRRKISVLVPEEHTLQRSVEKGHIAVYSSDQTRFVLPIKYLNTYIFGDLLKLSEEEFGLPGDGPITLLFDAAVIDYLLSFIENKVGRDVEKAFVVCFHGGY